MLSRKIVWATPTERRCSSVAQWSRASVKVAVGGGAEEGHVHDPLYAGVDGRVNKGEVLLDAVRQSRRRRP